MNRGLALLASGTALAALIGLALALLPTASPPPSAGPAAAPQTPPPRQAPPPTQREVTSAPEPLRAEAELSPGVTGEVAEGTLVVQLELGPHGIALLHHRLKPQLGFRLRAEGHHLAVVRDAQGTEARVRFAVPPRPSEPDVEHEVRGDELRVAHPTVLLKLPALTLPATLRAFDPQGTSLGEVELR